METPLDVTRQNTNTARLAASLFLFLCLPLAIWEIYVPGNIFVAQDPVKTASNLLANEFVFRLSIVSHLVGTIIFAFMVLLFYRIFRPVDKHLSLLMIAPVLLQIPIVFVFEIFQYGALMVLKSDPRPTFDLVQQQELSYFLLRMDRYGIGATKIFFGLSLVPFGMLVLRSGFVPRIFGILLIIAGVGYVAHTGSYLLMQRTDFLLVKPFVSYPFGGFILMLLWLLIKGVRDPKAIDNK